MYGGAMIRVFSILFVLVFALSACVNPPQDSAPPLGVDGKPLPRAYKIRPGDTAKIQFRMLDGINVLRQARGVPPFEMNAQLTAAAATHARDMAIQNRPWHFGSDGSSPLVRVQRVGYPGKLAAELISETYENENETLAAWMEQPDTRELLLDADADDMGFAWHQESNGKIWWTLVTGYRGAVVPGAGATAAVASDITVDSL